VKAHSHPQGRRDSAKVTSSAKATPAAKPALSAKGARARLSTAASTPKRAVNGSPHAAPAPASGSSRKRASSEASGKSTFTAAPSERIRTVAPKAPAKKPLRKGIKEAAGVSSDAVARRTGKSWDEWVDVLDAAGAATLDQRGVVAILAQKHGIGPWWQQMIAVGYEAVRHRAEKARPSDNFEINVSSRFQAPAAQVFRLWNDAAERARWLSDDRFVVRSALAGKSIQARWGKGISQVAVSFAERAGRTEVSVQHQQIESKAAADQMKAYWSKKLSLLQHALAASSNTQKL
jgi:hypothetical protein